MIVTRTNKGQNESKYGMNVSVLYWLMIWATYSFLKSFHSISINSQPVKLNQVTVNLQKIMIFSVSNSGTQWTLDFGPDSVVLSLKDLDENLTISSLEISVAAWSLLLSHRQEFLDNHLPRVPITPNQQGTFETREEVLPSVGAQYTDTSGYELSDLEDIEFSWEDPAVDMDSVYRPGTDTLFSPSIFDNFRMEGSTTANPIGFDDEEDKENAAATKTTPESERPTEPPRLLRSRPFGTRLENVSEAVYRTLFY